MATWACFVSVSGCVIFTVPMTAMRQIAFLLFLCLVSTGEAVRCYMCASSNSLKGDDSCGAYDKFDREQHIAIECNSEESPMPGSFCMKLVQQGERGFIWDGRWRQVIRRCASVADTGVTGVCNWGVYENGVYWEECYCSADECNSAIGLGVPSFLMLAFISLLAAYRLIV